MLANLVSLAGRRMRKSGLKTLFRFLKKTAGIGLIMLIANTMVGTLKLVLIKMTERESEIRPAGACC